MLNRSRIALPAAVLACIGFSGCTVRTVALHQTIGLLGKGTAAFYEEDDVRLAREAMPAQLKLLEGLLQNEPGNDELLACITQGFGGYAFLFIEEEDAKRAKTLYRRGRDYGVRALNPEVKGDLQAETDLDRFERLLNKLDKDDVPSLFWTAYCWGRMANLDLQNPQTLADLPKIERMMSRVNALEPGYFYGGADIFLGAYYGSRPKMFGGDLKKSREFFERALQASKRNFLMTQVLYAQYYAIAAQDRDLFGQLLKEVLDFQIESFPEQRLSNRVAKNRAIKLMEKIDDYF
jgi:hypothetical protein